MRTVYFDGYSPPVYLHLKGFDAKRLLKAVVEPGGNLLRFHPWDIGRTTQAFRAHPELGSRDLIDEVSNESRRLDIRFFCYTGYGHPHMKVGWVDEHPKYTDWVLRNPEGKAYGTYGHLKI